MSASGSWLCPEWPWTNPLPPLSPFCLCQVLMWSLRPPPTSPTDSLGSVPTRKDWALPAPALAGGLSFPKAWGSLPHCLLET